MTKISLNQGKLSDNLNYIEEKRIVVRKKIIREEARQRQITIKVNREKRRKRANHLLRLGITLEKTGLLELKEDVLITILLKYHNTLLTKKDIVEGEKILKKREKVDGLLLSAKERKARAHKLITKGALFEKVGIASESKLKIAAFCNKISKILD